MRNATDINRRIRIMALMTLLSITFIYILFKISKTPNTYSNNFKRTFHSESLLVPTYYRDLGSKGYYLAAHTGNGVFVGRYGWYSALEYLNDTFTTTTTLVLRDHPIDLSSSARFVVDSPRILLADPETGIVRFFHIAQNKQIQQAGDSLRIPSFGLLQSISFATLVLRIPDSNLKRNVLSKWNLVSCKNIITQEILQKQQDGFFCTDGLMDFDSDQAKLIYIYYYRNEFIALDTNLLSLYRARTIDTNRLAKIKVSRISSEDAYTFSAPPVSVNQQSCTGNGFLFIRSGLLADNEDRQVFGKSSVIDAYRIQDGKYQFSTHILDFEGFKLSEFRYFNHHIVAIQGPFIVYYPVTF